MWMRSEPCWPRIKVEMYQIVLAGHPRPVTRAQSSHIATGVATEAGTAVVRGRSDSETCRWLRQL